VLGSKPNGSKKVQVLIILDGWGIAPVWGGNAISIAKTKNFDQAYLHYPRTQLSASGPEVGLPGGAPGNSEAGHLNIGAGHVVHQDGAIIDEDIINGSFFNNQILSQAISHAAQNNSNLHLMGLLSKTGTHSQLSHIYALLKLIKAANFNRVYLHLFTDGRDSDPMSGIEMVAELEQKLVEYKIGQISTLIGRFFAMDRDNRWERIEKAYNLLVHGNGRQFPSAGNIFASSYSRGTTDEFIEPSIISNKVVHATTITDNDSVIFFNFRGDRSRELARAFLAPDFLEFPNRKLLHNLFFCSFVMHDENQLSVPVFKLKHVLNPLAEMWSKANLRQFHIAETEKYAHITYFLNGGVETPFPGEDRLMIPSPKTSPTYDLVPEMSIGSVVENVVTRLKARNYDCYAINFANPDMVGHTGNLKATVSAIEYVDSALGRVLSTVLEQDGIAYICADHGNAEQMVNPKTGDPDTEHTENPVPFILVSNDQNHLSLRLRENAALSSITPTILDTMGITGNEGLEKSLILKNEE